MSQMKLNMLNVFKVATRLGACSQILEIWENADFTESVEKFFKIIKKKGELEEFFINNGLEEFLPWSKTKCPEGYSGCYCEVSNPIYAKLTKEQVWKAMLKALRVR